jgi:anhydro-N-acetylmuramic acid kinase
MADTNLYIGIMTGTSMDAIDIVIARFEEFPEVIGEYSSPIDSALQKILLDLATKTEMNIDLFVRSHFVLTHEYVKAVNEALAKANLSSKDIRAIGLHGQTIRHLPESGATFQLGSGAALAALTGIDVVSDFRSGDIALGGEGAPLMPMFDYRFLRSDDRNRILLNIGGIANITFLPAGGDEETVMAFDTGPGNMVIDSLMKKLFDKPYDEGGKIAGNGKIDKDSLAELLKDQYFKRQPPKSTGRELFSVEFTKELKKKTARGAIFVDDAITTVTELTARSIADAMNFLPISNSMPTEIIASGGGVKNIFLCKRIGELLPKMKFRISDEIGIPSQAKEALAFAYFAKAFLNNEIIHLPKTTGASRKIILGSLSKGS